MALPEPRLAIVSTMSGLPWGGSEELWWATALAARRTGWNVLVSVDAVSREAPQLEVLRQNGIEVQTRSALSLWHGRIRRAAHLPHRPMARVAGFRPDVVLVSQGGTYDVADAPAIWHDFVAGNLSEIPIVLLCQFNRDTGPVEASRLRARALFDRAQSSLFVSARNLRDAQRQIAAPIQRARVVRNPVNLSDTTALGWPHGKVARLAVVARLETEFKGHDLLFEVLAHQRWRNRHWALSLYGDGPDLDYLKRLAKFLAIDDRIAFWGHVPDVRSIWRVEQMLVLPSRSEGTPLAMVEAMLCARPVVATRVGGCDEWVEDGSSGFVAPAAAAEPLDTAMERAWNQRDLWPALGVRGREIAVGLFDPSPAEAVLSELTLAAGVGGSWS